MAELSKIQTNTTWSDAANVINNNNDKINAELTSLKSSTTNFKGYFTDISSLQSAFPNPKDGQTAWVGSPYPGTVYKANSGSWTNTSEVPSVPEVELNDYYDKMQVDSMMRLQDDNLKESIAELDNKTNSKVFTTNVNANKVIRKLFIDTSGYSGSLSLDGLKLKIIAKNVGGLYGIQLGNSKNETIMSPWMDAANSIQSVTSNGIYFYIEYNWDNMSDGQLPGSPFELTNEAFNSINDVRGSIDSEKLADGSISENKIKNGVISENKLSTEVVEKLNNPRPNITDGTLDLMKLKLTPNFLSFYGGNLFNVLDYEGFNKNPKIWSTSDGGQTEPIITVENVPNILGLKYSRCFIIKDILYNGSYYSNPYFVLKLKNLTGAQTKSFCFYVNIEYLYGLSRALFSAFNWLDNAVSVYILWGKDIHKESSKSINGTTSHLSVDIFYINYNNEKWAFVRGKFWVDDVSFVQDSTPTFVMQFNGGEGHIGEKTVTCGWTFVEGDVELIPFQYYPYNKNFFELFTEQYIPDGSITTDKINNNAVTQEKINTNVNLSTTTLTNGLYGQAGDSISEGAGLQTLLSDSDPYTPISGTKKATYGYYIAKLNRMRWANYGISGSTLGFVIANGSDKNGFSKENGRYTQMDNNLTHISIFFGWNDAAYGPIMKKEEWLQSTYSKKIYYPRSLGLIGTSADDGTPYATQDQYDAVNAVTGRVGEIDYDNSNDYFNALYVGTKDDSTNTTFWGAWNIVLPYLINKYPLAKILLIVPFGCYALLRQCVRDAALKYGLATYDFSDTNNQLFRQWDDNPARGMVNDKIISQFRIDSLTYDGLHPNKDGYEYMYKSINAKLMSL